VRPFDRASCCIDTRKLAGTLAAIVVGTAAVVSIVLTVLLTLNPSWGLISECISDLPDVEPGPEP
jgi:hypothetical protein